MDIAVLTAYRDIQESAAVRKRKYYHCRLIFIRYLQHRVIFVLHSFDRIDLLIYRLAELRPSDRRHAFQYR